MACNVGDAFKPRCLSWCLYCYNWHLFCCSWCWCQYLWNWCLCLPISWRWWLFCWHLPCVHTMLLCGCGGVILCRLCCVLIMPGFFCSPIVPLGLVLTDLHLCALYPAPLLAHMVLNTLKPGLYLCHLTAESESESGYISSSHIRLIRCLAVIGQASFTREHLV